ncbi:AAA family ATPase [Nocardia otitidiscaviarum]|uniref:AAA family ATPase n=1 Tax=Nocardia otitidiscaviarum TaxID=1823 RepID=UPI0018958D08|nr:AAA family ATPase [Nocardia otitidiscaviarum]MBF6177719.1 AAA family ATPase [Nocardia otitidiscaviarum]
MTSPENEASTPPGFKALTLHNWRQFERVELDFHPHLTILTGANATGKSTILGILGRHFNWSRSYSASPVRHDGDEDVEWKTFWERDSDEQTMVPASHEMVEIGKLTYGFGESAPISVPARPTNESQRSNYDLHMPHSQQVKGAFLTSHRSMTNSYTQVDTIPTLFGDADQIFEQFTNEIRVRWAGSWSGKSPQRALKESLIAAATFGGRGNDSVDFNPEAAAVWTGFQEVLKKVMPRSAGYTGMRVRVPDVIVQMRSGDFILDDVSGGLSAIIEVSWQIFLKSRAEPTFTVLLDEPENHLHPSLQREILPSLLRAFPSVQFIVATHSPFVVTATPDSAVYALDYNDSERVESRLLDYANKAASADATLRRVLGVESTMPRWAEEAFDEIVNRYASGPLDTERLRALRNELKERGLDMEFPDAVIALTDRDKPGTSG